MAPPAKKSKTVAAPPGAKGSLQKFFGSQGGPKPVEAPAEEENVAPNMAPASTPEVAPASVLPPIVTPERTSHEASQLTPSPTPFPMEVCTPTATPAASKPGLSSEQLAKIEENRRKARELQLSKKRALEEAETSLTKVQPSATSATPPPEEDACTTPPAKVAPSPGGLAKPKAGPSRAKAKAKAEAKAEASPQKSATQAVPGMVDATPEKMALPAQEKRSTSTPKSLSSAAAPGSFATSRDGGKFDQHRCETWQQYTSVYAARLGMLKGNVLEEARAVWGGQVPPQAFQPEISGYTKQSEVVIAGIVFKDLKSRPNVIDQFKKNPLFCKLLSEESMTGKVPEPGSFCSDNDRLFLEDASMRVRLEVEPALLHSLCSGLVVAVKGTAEANGDFKVNSVAFSRMPAPPVMKPVSGDLGSGPYIALLSGLAPPSGTPEEALSKAHDRLVEFLGATPLERVLVCGGALCSRPVFDASARSTMSGEVAGVEVQKISREARLSADELLARIAGIAPVQLMPGQADPTNLSLPQMPLHPHLFQKARACGNMKSVSNPYSGTVESSGLSLLGHSGQPVQDILRSTRGKAPLAALQMCLEARHLAPTAPETLAMPPLQGGDPFIIHEVPHVLFSGGHARAEHHWVPALRGTEGRSGTQCICVPAFHEQQAVVLVNARDPRDVRVHVLSV